MQHISLITVIIFDGLGKINVATEETKFGSVIIIWSQPFYNMRLMLYQRSCELKSEMEAIQQQMVEAKKNDRANALKEVKHLCKEFGFTDLETHPFNKSKFG